MTDEELAPIKSRVVRFTPAMPLTVDAATYAELTAMTFDARALLAEVEQWREIGQRLAVIDGPWVSERIGLMQMRDDARALLAGNDN